MDGLEAVEVKFSDLERTKRVDSEFFLKEYVVSEKALFARAVKSVPQVANTSDGNHLKISDSFTDDGIPYYRGQDANHFFIEQSEPVHIEEAVYRSANMKRSHLRSGDVLLSIVGTIGGVSLVSTNQPATCSCKLAILRPQTVKSGYLAAYLHSKYGQYQIQRFTRGAVQMGLILEDLDQIFVSQQSSDFETVIETIVQKSKTTLDESQKLHQEAENILLEHLGLKDWKPSEAGVSVKSFAESFGTSARLDAEHYQPKYDELTDAIKSNAPYCRHIKEFRTYNARGLQPEYVADGQLNVINSRHILEQHLDYENFEKTDVTAWQEQVRARVFENDILTYTTGANIGRTNVYLKSQSALASNHVNILRVKDANPIYTGFVMNSAIGRLQTEKLSAGSAQAELYPKDIDEFLIPFIDEEAQQQIVLRLEASLEAKKQAQQLLDFAKRGVELAIEESEAAALVWIEAQLAELGLDLTLTTE